MTSPREYCSSPTAEDCACLSAAPDAATAASEESGPSPARRLLELAKDACAACAVVWVAAVISPSPEAADAAADSKPPSASVAPPDWSDSFCRFSAALLASPPASAMALARMSEVACAAVPPCPGAVMDEPTAPNCDSCLPRAPRPA